MTLPLALAALIPVMIGPLPGEAETITARLCNGGTITIPTGDGAPDDAQCHPKGCHAGTCRDTQTDLSHCGACGNACPARANATSTCAAGACGFTCNAGFADCNMDPDDGCETSTARAWPATWHRATPRSSTGG